nr:MAG TPA: hypothetical protein [Caudoviricetes sp.]
MILPIKSTFLLLANSYVFGIHGTNTEHNSFKNAKKIKPTN